MIQSGSASMNYSVNNKVTRRMLRAAEFASHTTGAQFVLIECGRAFRRCTVDNSVAEKQMKSSRRQVDKWPHRDGGRRDITPGAHKPQGQITSASLYPFA